MKKILILLLISSIISCTKEVSSTLAPNTDDNSIVVYANNKKYTYNNKNPIYLANTNVNYAVSQYIMESYFIYGSNYSDPYNKHVLTIAGIKNNTASVVFGNVSTMQNSILEDVKITYTISNMHITGNFVGKSIYGSFKNIKIQ